MNITLSNVTSSAQTIEWKSKGEWKLPSWGEPVVSIRGFQSDVISDNITACRFYTIHLDVPDKEERLQYFLQQQLPSASFRTNRLRFGLGKVIR